MRDILACFAHVRANTHGWTARCPAHPDDRSSLSINHGEIQPWVFKCFVGCTTEAIVAAAGLTMADILEPNGNGNGTIVATYDYCTAGGLLVYQVVRLTPKTFRQRRPDGKGWIWKLGDVPRVLYRLPQLQGQTVAYVTEGERDANALAALGLAGTTNAGGAGKWRPEYVAQLQAATVEHVVVLPDNDDPGRAHAFDVARSCHAAGLQVKLVELPDLPPKGDVSDWLAAGHTRDELVAIVRATALYSPATTPHPDDLVLTGIGDLLSEPDDAIDWIIHDRFSYGSVNLLAGKPKAGKSTLARYLAFCIATGTWFLGHRTIAGAVWYLVLEDKRSEVKRHFRALEATGREPIRFLFGNDRRLLEKVASLAERERPAAIIVDTLQRLIGARDLNDYAEVTTKLTPILRLARATGAALILIHHAGKADRAGIDSVLGSTALAGSVDNIFLLNRTDRYRLLSSIQRIGPDLPETVLTLDATGRTDAGQSRHDADVASVRTMMLAALENAGNVLTRADWLDAVEGRRQVKLEALKGLVESGTISRDGEGTKADPYRYAITLEKILVPVVPTYMREPQSDGALFAQNANVSAQNCGSQDLGNHEGSREPQSDVQEPREPQSDVPPELSDGCFICGRDSCEDHVPSLESDDGEPI